MSVVLETTAGDLTVDLYTKERPKSCLNFLKLCKQKKYNLSLFHSVQSNFIAQTGDPTATGRGGESVFGDIYGQQARYFEAETNPRIKHTKKGLLSMVNCGDGMLGSQFFFTLDDDLDYLDGEHCVFGELVEGWDILDKINQTICDADNRPYQDIRITHTVVLHDPYDDPPGFEPRSDSPTPDEEMLASSRIRADEDINDYDGKTSEEINEILATKEAEARATILEMVGDLPDANVAPPENVLFVCKLNPVTNDDDLEIIFARFGKVVCCEVIRDKKTGDSLQYAFVEFDNQESCEQAYFKMDNVLIDDRRIHVDFSQSVSKYKWKGKGRLEVMDDKKGAVKENGRSGDTKQKQNGSNLPDLKHMVAESKKKDRRVRSRSRDQRRSRSRDRRRSQSRDRKKNKKRDRSTDRTRDRSVEKRRVSPTDRKRDRSTDRKRDRSTGRKRDGSTDRKRDISTDRKYDRSTDRKRERYDRSRSRDRKNVAGTNTRKEDRRRGEKVRSRRERSYS